MKLTSDSNWLLWNGKADNTEGYSLQVSDVKPQKSAQFALELWYPEGCEAYPGSSITFSEAQIQQTDSSFLAPSWRTSYENGGPQCGQKVTVNGPEGVTITSNEGSPLLAV
jgi:hypothetical protein